jgi:hypothetical protein
MKASRELPKDYVARYEIDLAKNRLLAVLLNIAGLGFFIPFGWLFIRLAQLLRPDFSPSRGNMENLVIALGILAAFIVVLVLHELVHGLLFWIITGDRPLFGLRLAYAYAAAPGWYIPRNPYLAVGLAPLTLITLLGILLIPLVPEIALPSLVFALVTNAAGAIGDIAIVVWLLTQPDNVLIRDCGDAIKIYRQTHS